MTRLREWLLSRGGFMFTLGVISLGYAAAPVVVLAQPPDGRIFKDPETGFSICLCFTQPNCYACVS